jgi:hypothetical protein
MRFANVFNTVSFELFAIVYAQLRLLQMQNAFISFEDIEDSVRFASKTTNVTLLEDDIQDYAGVILEATLRPIYLRSVGGKLCLKSELINSEEKYFHEIIKTLEEKRAFEGDVEPVWRKFLRDVDIYLRGSVRIEDDVPRFVNPSEAVSYNLKKPVGNEIPDYFEESFKSSPFNEEHEVRSHPGFVQYQQQQQYDKPPQKMRSMKHEGIQRLMNSFRKAGMDLIFPPVIHEKVKLNSLLFISFFVFSNLWIFSFRYCW